jgi:hypothetical protein
MARIKPPFPLSGRWAGLSVYSMRGVKDLVARQPYGPSAKDIQTKDCYALTRRNNSEFRGQTAASKWLRRNFQPLEPIRDYPMSGPVTGFLKCFLALDTERAFGKRNVYLSRAPRLLEGINMSQRYSFDAVVRGGLAYTLSREELTASITTPLLQPRINFIPPDKQPYFRVVATLGLAPDVFWTPYGYIPSAGYERLIPAVAQSEWNPTAKGAEAITLELGLSHTPPDGSFALVLTVGIMMGTAGRGDKLEAVNYAGCAKVLAAV